MGIIVPALREGARLLLEHPVTGVAIGVTTAIVVGALVAQRPAPPVEGVLFKRKRGEDVPANENGPFDEPAADGLDAAPTPVDVAAAADPDDAGAGHLGEVKHIPFRATVYSDQVALSR